MTSGVAPTVLQCIYKRGDNNTGVRKSRCWIHQWCHSHLHTVHPQKRWH